ncbi:MAG: hypothetical protein IKZ88_00730 [Neisseriaceae bacterium]|nr:hypothetical protein [Neisseriaceae bacterium]
MRLLKSFRQPEKDYCHYEHSRKAMRSNLLTITNGNAKRFSGSLNN